MKIAILGIGRLKPGVLDEAARSIQTLFHCEAQGCPPLEIPAGAFDTRRNQYSSVEFMLALAHGNFGEADRVMGLTRVRSFSSPC